MRSHFPEYGSHQVWLFEDPVEDDRWVVYLVDHIDWNIVRSRVLASSGGVECVGTWFCFADGSWFDEYSKRIS